MPSIAVKNGLLKNFGELTLVAQTSLTQTMAEARFILKRKFPNLKTLGIEKGAIGANDLGNGLIEIAGTQKENQVLGL